MKKTNSGHKELARTEVAASKTKIARTEVAASKTKIALSDKEFGKY